MPEPTIVILDLEVPDAGPVFLTALALHVAAGPACVVSGASESRLRRPVTRSPVRMSGVGVGDHDERGPRRNPRYVPSLLQTSAWTSSSSTVNPRQDSSHGRVHQLTDVAVVSIHSGTS
ncbi:hypothetical protein Pen01_11610 [Phytomonospora endophytica]|nr:hypothetical protein Pen01_11610 [Phytomonospora endophytica]